MGEAILDLMHQQMKYDTQSGLEALFAKSANFLDDCLHHWSIQVWQNTYKRAKGEKDRGGHIKSLIHFQTIIGSRIDDSKNC